MGWVDKTHKCNLPFYSHGGVGKVGAIFECDHCKKTWRVTSRTLSEQEGFYNLTFVYREGDYVVFRNEVLG